MGKTNDVTLVATYIAKADVERLDYIVREYGFKSRYQIIKTIIEAFLKVADPRPEEVANKDIEDMFNSLQTASFDDFDTTKDKHSI